MKPEDFSEIVPSPEAFEFRGINLFKVFYNHFANRALGHENSALKPWVKKSVLQQIPNIPASLWGLTKLVAHAIFRGNKSKIFYYGMTNRLSEIDGKTYDLYNYHIIESLGRDRFFIYQDTPDKVEKTYGPDMLMDHLLIIGGFYTLIVKLFYNVEIKRLAAKIASIYPDLGFSAEKAESIISGFYISYLTLRILLRLVHPEEVIVMCHYYRENLTAAAKSLGLRVTELMHGLINRAHAYYYFSPNYPASARGIYPDRLGVYGEYWREILISRNFLPAESVFVSGYYLQVPASQHITGRADKTRILFCTQPTVQPEVLAYIRFLKDHLDREKWEVVVRPHPAEISAPYLDLEEPGFVTISFENTYGLLNRTDINISPYSTVLYEAVRYPICNYALFVPRVEKQWREVVDSGVARPLRPDELPRLYPITQEFKENYFAEFCPEAIFKKKDLGVKNECCR